MHKEQQRTRTSTGPGRAPAPTPQREVYLRALSAGAMERMEGMVAVLDEDRRIVFANQPFQDFLGEDADGICGSRPGNAFSCIHAEETEGGCGTSESCRLCGAAQAILETQASARQAVRECRITANREGAAVWYDFLVRTSPFTIEDRRYVLVSFSDISDQKRRAALERVFFHDILNTASSIKVFLELLKAGTEDPDNRRLLGRLEDVSLTLIEEINSQKVLASAENRTLSVQRNLLVSGLLLEHVVRQLEGQEIARDRKIVTAGFSESFSLVSDDTLVRRVLSNMLRNAIEASPEGATVTIGCAAKDAEARFWVHNPGAMSADVQRQVFQRYFSTKGPDRGMGTYSMKLLAEEYLGGSISFESGAETGTRFTLTLPLKPLETRGSGGTPWASVSS